MEHEIDNSYKDTANSLRHAADHLEAVELELLKSHDENNRLRKRFIDHDREIKSAADHLRRGEELKASAERVTQDALTVYREQHEIEMNKLRAMYDEQVLRSQKASIAWQNKYQEVAAELRHLKGE